MGKARMRIDSRVLQMAEDKKKGVLYIYDTVQNDGYDWWNGEKIVSETSEAFIRDRLAEMGAVEELDIHISSSGWAFTVRSSPLAAPERLHILTAWRQALPQSLLWRPMRSSCRMRD